jgi:hypothetical protein
MNFIDQPRTDIPPFKSFADAVKQVSAAVARLKELPEYLELTVYEKLRKDMAFCKSIAESQKIKNQRRSSEYNRLRGQFAQNFAAPAQIREEIQKQLRNLAFDPLHEANLKQAIEFTLHQVNRVFDSLKSELEKKRSLSVLINIPEQKPGMYDLERGI